MANSVAARAAFDAALGGGSTIDFESALPASVTFVGGSVPNTSCGAVCGFNTTAGGENSLYLSRGTTTFAFTAPIDSFGFCVTGLQTIWWRSRV